METFDAVVVGSGPNGLSAAITLARAGRSVLVVEARETIGGAVASGELTLPGFVHDSCSSVFPLGVGSPFFQSLPLSKHGLEWVHPEFPVAHPLGGGRAVILERSLEATAARLGEDGAAYRALFVPYVSNWPEFADGVLRGIHIPASPLLMARFGLHGLRAATEVATGHFATEAARALFGGNAAHSIAPLSQAGTAAIAMVMIVSAHAVGWPFVRGGSRVLATALAAHLESLGGVIRTGTTVASLDELPQSRLTLLDLTPRQVISVAGKRLPQRYVEELAGYRYGPGCFKVDWALDGPIPWAAEECARAGTIHIGGTLEEVARSEANLALTESPFVLLAQPTVCDATRAPAGGHTAWAYCHVPNGSMRDMTEIIERQVERFAPGFRDRILARHVQDPVSLESENANLIGGDISGGANTLRQMFLRPTARIHPHRTPVRGLYICSASTPPGAGVHGMCGYLAATLALHDTA